MSASAGGASAAARVREAARAARATARRLRALGRAAVCAALDRAAALLRDPTSDVGAEALAVLPQSSGLSVEMVRWALDTSLPSSTGADLLALAEAWIPDERATGALALPCDLAGVVLAGNVLTAPFRALAAPLVAGAPVVARVSAREARFAQLLARALAAARADLEGALQVVSFAHDDADAERALLEAVDALSVYGSDATIAHFRARAAAVRQEDLPLRGHGHGLGAAYVTTAALESPEHALAAARALALDVAAYDQRGCLSPQVVFVARAGRVSPRALARALAFEGLGPLARDLPRGPLPVEVGAAQLQWRGVAASRGELFEGDGFAVSYEADAGLRMGPGYRNVLVLECGDARDLARRLDPLGRHLKCLGVAGAAGDDDAGAEVRRALAALLPPPMCPAVVPAGEMQIPGLGGPQDGASPFDPFLRYARFTRR